MTTCPKGGVSAGPVKAKGAVGRGHRWHRGKATESRLRYELNKPRLKSTANHRELVGVDFFFFFCIYFLLFLVFFSFCVVNGSESDW